MTRLLLGTSLLTLATLASGPAPQELPAASPAVPAPVAAPVAESTPEPAPTPVARNDADDALWDEAARAAWRYFDERVVDTTGFAPSTTQYSYVTAWDIGSILGAEFSAHHLGLVPRADYERRMGRLLATLEKLPLFDEAAFNKSYSVRGSRMNRGNEQVGRGYGWSALDVGRLLLWLHIVATDSPDMAGTAQRIVARLDASRIAKDGYLRGASLERNGTVVEYQEGKIGYEGYAARGYAAWRLPVENALDVRKHGVPAEFSGRRILLDDRGHDRLTSEPFVLAGIEVGWEPAERELAEAVRGLQDDRWRRTGQVTIVSEDASELPPHHFYYYCVYAYGGLFRVVVHDPDAALDGPRWVSTKAAFGWEALRPGGNSRAALDAVVKARSRDGWAAGVLEGSGDVAGPVNLNTQAVVLEAALYRRAGKPLLQLAREGGRP